MGDLEILGRLEKMGCMCTCSAPTNHHLSLQNNSHAQNQGCLVRTGVPSVNISLSQEDGFSFGEGRPNRLDNPTSTMNG